MPVRRIWWVMHFLKFKKNTSALHRQRLSADYELGCAIEEWLRAVKAT